MLKNQAPGAFANMPYSSFSLQSAIQQFSLKYSGSAPIFPAVMPALPATGAAAIALLNQQLERDADMARRTPSEKAKSEFVIAPVLATLRQIQKVGIHSGVSFDVSAEENLRGACDFLVTLSDELEIIEAPVLVVVEAKRSIMSEGLGQCVAEMVASQRFNQQANLPPSPIFGCITNGFYWRFLQLVNSEVLGDAAIEYPLRPTEALMQRLSYTISVARAETYAEVESAL